jgi:hypothetical protein
MAVINLLSNRKYIHISLWISLLFYNIIFLSHSKTYYTTASKISKATFQEINSLKGKQRLFIDSLPQSVNGALIFRLGFDEGVQWLKQSGTVDSIYVLSLKEDNANWDVEYTTVNPEIYSIVSFSQVLVRDTTHQNTYVKRVTSPIPFNQQTDAWFIYRNNALEVIK